MIKRCLIFVALASVVCVCGLFFVLNSPKSTASILTLVAKTKFRHGAINRFTIEKQKFSYPDQISFSNIDIDVFLIDQGVLKFHIDELQINGLQTLIRAMSNLPVTATGILVEQKEIKFVKSVFVGQINLKNRGIDTWQGLLEIPLIEAYRYKGQNVSSELSGGPNDVLFKNLSVDFYAGKITGQAKVTWEKDVRYSTDLRFDGVDLNALKEVDDSIHGQIEGVIQGSLVLGGSPKSFDTLGLKVQVTKNGRLNASLLKFILPYIPRTEDSIKLLEIMKVPGSKVPVEIAHMELETIDEHKISGNVKLGVGRLNLDLNLPIDILYDGNLLSLITWYKKLGK